MSELQVLHVLPELSRGGASAAALGAAKHSARLGGGAHTVVSLRPAGPAGLEAAALAGLPVLNAPGQSELAEVAARADIVQIHFWNTPELYELLRADWPPARVAIWLHIGGFWAPQRVTPALAAFADAWVAGSRINLDLPSFAPSSRPHLAHIEAGPDFDRLAGCAPQPHAGFNIGYIGTVDFAKMHQDFIAMSAAINIREARFIVCGEGRAYPELRRQAEALGAAGRFDFRGFVNSVGAVLETLDVLGYPLCPENYSGAELVLQEAMYVGVPAVVLPYGGAARTVAHNVTGLVVNDAAGYRDAVEYLYQHPDERERLAQNGREAARAGLGAEAAGRQFNELYAWMLSQPKRERHWKAGIIRKGRLDCQAAEWFIESLGEDGEAFEISLNSLSVDKVLRAEANVAASPPGLCSGAGGILDYRRRYPDDACLRLWAGLVLRQQGQAALAVAELDKAIKLGCTHWRVRWYLAQAAADCGARQLALEAMAAVAQAAPEFNPAAALTEQLRSDSAGVPESGGAAG